MLSIVPLPADSAPANAATEISLNVAGSQSPDEATPANVATIPPPPSPPANIPEDDTECPAPPQSPTADPLLAFDPSEAPNNTSDVTFPLLATGGKNAFKLDDTCEDLVDEDIVAYLEAVPGGVRWIEMIQSYRTLAQLPPTKEVSSQYYYFLVRKTNDTI